MIAFFSKNLMIFTSILAVTSCVEANEMTGTITKMEGDVEIFSHPAKEIKGPPPHALFEGEYYAVAKAKPGSKIEQGNIIRTAVNAQAKVVFENGDQINVGSATAYRVKWEKGRSSTLSMMYGKFRAVISKQGPRNNMKIKAGNTVMGIRGTDFFVSKDGTQNNVKVATLRGTVSVEQSGKKAVVSQGMSAEVKEQAIGDKKDIKIDTRPSTKQELNKIQTVSTIQNAEKVDSNQNKVIEKLEEKAKQIILTDIKTYDPALYDKIRKEKLSSDELNSNTVIMLAKNAPEAKESKPSLEELEETNRDQYEKYFKEFK